LRSIKQPTFVHIMKLNLFLTLMIVSVLLVFELPSASAQFFRTKKVAKKQNKEQEKIVKKSHKGKVYKTQNVYWDPKKQEYYEVDTEWDERPEGTYYDPKEWQKPKHKKLVKRRGKKPKKKSDTKDPDETITPVE